MTTPERCSAGDMGCSQAAARVSGCSFTGNAGGRGGAISASGNAALALWSSNFTGNAARTAGGAVQFDSLSPEPLDIRGSAFSSNAAATGGAVAVLAASAVAVLSSNFTANNATGGDGGALAVAGSVGVFPCVAGEVVTLSGPRGTIVVADGAMPTTVSFECQWRLHPPPSPSDAGSACSIELVIAGIQSVNAASDAPLTEAVSVESAGNGTTLQCENLGCLGVKNRLLSSRDPAGLLLRYRWETTGEALPLANGLTARWRTVCGAAGRPAGELLTVSLEGVVVANNTAAANGAETEKGASRPACAR